MGSITYLEEYLDRLKKLEKLRLKKIIVLKDLDTFGTESTPQNNVETLKKIKRSKSDFCIKRENLKKSGNKKNQLKFFLKKNNKFMNKSQSLLKLDTGSYVRNKPLIPFLTEKNEKKIIKIKNDSSYTNCIIEGDNKEEGDLQNFIKKNKIKKNAKNQLLPSSTKLAPSSSTRQTSKRQRDNFQELSDFTLSQKTSRRSENFNKMKVLESDSSRFSKFSDFNFNKEKEESGIVSFRDHAFKENSIKNCNRGQKFSYFNDGNDNFNFNRDFKEEEESRRKRDLKGEVEDSEFRHYFCQFRDELDQDLKDSGYGNHGLDEKNEEILKKIFDKVELSFAQKSQISEILTPKTSKKQGIIAEKSIEEISPLKPLSTSKISQNSAKFLKSPPMTKKRHNFPLKFPSIEILKQDSLDSQMTSKDPQNESLCAYNSKEFWGNFKKKIDFNLENFGKSVESHYFIEEEDLELKKLILKTKKMKKNLESFGDRKSVV